MPSQLEPGNTHSVECDLNYEYGYGFDAFLPCGRYEISYLVTEFCESNTVRLEIIEPTGEMAEASNLFALALKHEINVQWKRADSLHSEVVKRYPQSYFAMKSLANKVSINKFFIGDRAALIEASKTILTCPGLRAMMRYIDLIKEDYLERGDIAGPIAYFTSLSVNTQNPRLYAIINNKILSELNAKVDEPGSRVGRD